MEPSPPDKVDVKSAPPAPDLLPRVYEAMKSMARQQMSRERPGHTLSATALVHEAYLRVAGDRRRTRFADEAQFFHAAAQAMRRILIEHARSRGRQKRDGGGVRVFRDVAELTDSPALDEILAVEEAVCRLEREMPDVAQVVRLHFYAGRSMAETAAALGRSERSVYRDWQFARAWLVRQLDGLGYR